MHIDLGDGWGAEEAEEDASELAEAAEAFRKYHAALLQHRASLAFLRGHRFRRASLDWLRKEIGEHIDEIDRLMESADGVARAAEKEWCQYSDAVADWAERDAESKQPHARKERVW